MRVSMACRPYAEAMARGERRRSTGCPPGGAEGIVLLSALLGVYACGADPEHGVEQSRAVARIDELRDRSNT